MKSLYSCLLASVVFAASCKPGIPEDLQEQSSKEFWAKTAKEAVDQDSIGLVRQIDSTLQQGELVVLSASSEWMSTREVKQTSFNAAIVNKENDTLARLSYMKNFFILSAEYVAETGIESVRQERATIELNKKDVLEPHIFIKEEDAEHHVSDHKPPKIEYRLY